MSMSSCIFKQMLSLPRTKAYRTKLTHCSVPCKTCKFSVLSERTTPVNRLLTSMQLLMTNFVDNTEFLEKYWTVDNMPYMEFLPSPLKPLPLYRISIDRLINFPCTNPLALAQIYTGHGQ